MRVLHSALQSQTPVRAGQSWLGIMKQPSNTTIFHPGKLAAFLYSKAALWCTGRWEMVVWMWRAKKNVKNLKFDYNLLISVYRLQLHCAIVNFKLMVPSLPACLVCSIQNNLIPPNFVIIPKLGIMQSLPSRHWLARWSLRPEGGLKGRNIPWEPQFDEVWIIFQRETQTYWQFWPIIRPRAAWSNYIFYPPLENISEFGETILDWNVENISFVTCWHRFLREMHFLKNFVLLNNLGK